MWNDARPMITMTLMRQAVVAGQPSQLGRGAHALRVLSGTLRGEGQGLQAGDGGFAAAGTMLTGDAADVLVFSLAARAPVGEVMLGVEFDLSEPALLRLDQVSFPPGATAWRHVHPGPGIRCLLNGSFTLQSDTHSQAIAPLTPWFEPALSPVQAIADPHLATAFVRAMVLPLAYEGKPSIRYLDAQDAHKPKVQKNHRFFDHRIDPGAL